MTTLPERTRAAISSTGGAFLAAGTDAVASLRSVRKPLHPRGVLLSGRIHRRGSDPVSGVPWLDQPGDDEAIVRLSRALGLPDALPDIHGLAVRVFSDQGVGDLLYASTGWSRLGRFVLRASRDPRGRPLTTLLPYRTAEGPVTLGARALGVEGYELSWARGGHDWQPFGVLMVSGNRSQYPDVSFDPVHHQIVGLQQYTFVTRLREPSYSHARRSRT